MTDITDKLAALDRLIARVGNGERPSSSSFRKVFSGHGGLNASRACSGSLDAALSLKDALLTTECHWSVAECDDRGFVARVYLSGWHESSNASPARALLIATLKAYRYTVAEVEA